MKLISQLLICLSLFITFNSEAKTSAKTQYQIGALAKVQGAVLINGRPAKSGDAIFANSSVVTDGESTVTVLLGEGMVALLGYNSVLELEKFSNAPTKIKNSKSTIKNELAQFNLRLGSVRMLVRKDNDTVRLATVRAGDSFGIVKDGEAHFNCDVKCARFLLNSQQANQKVTK